MYYAHGLVDKNNIIRTVEDIMCSANDSSHETITDFKESVENKLDDFYTKMETQDCIDTAITNFQTNVLKKSYITRQTTQDRIDTAVNDLDLKLDNEINYIGLVTIPREIDDAIDDLMGIQIPDQYYNKNEVDNQIGDKINEYNSDIVLNYATKEFVNKTKNDILSECQQSFYTKSYIDENYYSTKDHNVDITALTNKILELERRIVALEK